MKLVQRASGLVMSIFLDRPDLQSSLKTVMIAKPLEITKSRLGKIERYLEDKPVLEYVLCVPERGGRVHGVRRSRDTPINNGGTGQAGKPLH